MANCLLFNYHDACIYASDLHLVESPTAWLNDACINFQLTRLDRKMRLRRSHGNDVDDSSCGKSPLPLLFVDPTVVSYMMHQCDEEDLIDLGNAWRAELREQNSPHKRAMIFLPINDNNGADADAFQRPGGGIHWSMLAVILLESNSCKSGENLDFKIDFCAHFDSSGHCNEGAAKAVATKLSRAIDSNCHSNSQDVVRCSTPQQNNGYDCGIFTLGFAEALSSETHIWAGTPVSGVIGDMEEAVKSFIAANGGAGFSKNMRSRIANDIRGLAAAKDAS